MSQDSRYAKKLNALLKRMKKPRNGQPVVEQDPINQLILGFLQWCATTKGAETGYKKLRSVMVDHNDLRVSHPQEIVAVLGQRYPRVQERAERLLRVLQEVYIREHAMSLSRLASKSKKEVRAYLNSLPGMTPYVAAQLTLLSFGGHAVPVDEVLVHRLRNEGAAAPEATLEQVESSLERAVRAGQGAGVHAGLRAWADGWVDRYTTHAAAEAAAAEAKKIEAQKAAEAARVEAARAEAAKKAAAKKGSEKNRKKTSKPQGGVKKKTDKKN